MTVPLQAKILSPKAKAAWVLNSSRPLEINRLTFVKDGQRMACINASMPTRESKRKELRTAIMLMSGLAVVMFLFVMVAKNFIAGPG